MSLRSLCVWLGLLTIGAALGAPPALAQSAANFYKGKTITLIVSSSTGGGYDTTARVIARHLPDHIPGHPTIIVQNMPGGGGIAATNYLYHVARKDGTVIGGVQNNTPFEPLLGTVEAHYNPTKFNWLGSPNIETGLLAVWYKTPVNSIQDLKTHQITVGASGANSTPSFYARLINAVLGTKIKIIVGYPGQNEAFLAVERGEIDGWPSLFYSTMMATKADWVKQGKLKILLQYGLTKEKALPNVPSLLDMVTKPDDKALLKAGLAEISLGRPYLMPPGVPADRVALMQKAMWDTFNDPKFKADAIHVGLGTEHPRSGENVRKLIEDTYAAPPKVVKRLRSLMFHG